MHATVSKSPRRVAIALQIEEPYPHHQDVFAGIQRYAREHPNWRCTVDQHPTYESRRRGLPARPYDGVIARSWPGLQARLRRLRIPLVNTHYQEHRPGITGVYQNPVSLGQLAADHLIQRGFDRLGLAWNPKLRKPTVSNAFLQRVRDESRHCDVLPLEADVSTDLKLWIAIETKTRQWLTSLRPPVAIFVDNAFMARIIVQMSQAMGRHVPQDVSVLCEEDLKEVVSVAPQISTTADNFEKVGYEAAALLDRLMDGKPAPEQPIYVEPRGINARASTDYYAVEDPLIADALRFISANLGEKLRAEDIAYELAVSVSTLQKRFAKALGRGVAQEMRRLRLSAVKVLLADPENTVKMIARKTGFNSAVVLNHVFKRELGMTPSAYRKRVLVE